MEIRLTHRCRQVLSEEDSNHSANINNWQMRLEETQRLLQYMEMGNLVGTNTDWKKIFAHCTSERR